MNTPKAIVFQFISTLALFVAIVGCGSESAGPGPSDAAESPAQDASDDASDALADAAPDAAVSGPVRRTGPLDYAGRPYVESVLLEADVRANYNDKASVLADAGGTLAAASKRLQALDMVDGIADWPGSAPSDAGAGGSHALSYLMSFNALVIDPNLPFSETSFLDVERHGSARRTCGGRWFAEQATNVLASWWTSADRSAVTLVAPFSGPTASQTFPYLPPAP